MKIRKYRKNHVKKGRSGTATVPGMKGIVTVLILCILLVLTGCGNDQIHKTNEKISSENKQYMDSLINESKGMEKVDVKKKPGKIIHATRYEADVELDTVNKVISGRSVIYFRNDSDDAVDSVVLRNYSAVGNDPYNEPWLDESFAEFLECFVFPVSGADVLTDIEDELSREQGEYYEPGLQTVSDFFDEKDQILEQQDNKKKIELSYDRYDKSNDEYSQYVYDSGAFFLYELEKTMGDAEFFSMLQGYYDTYRFSEVKTSDFISFVKAYYDSESVDKVISKYITDM